MNLFSTNNMRLISNTFITFIFLLLANCVSAQDKYPSTFLWRITGNGLSKPSYLYGTMHVQDRRLFYFGDSIYNAIEQTSGFAMEVNPEEMMDSLFKYAGKKDTSALIKDLFDEKEFKRIAKKLEKRLKIPADKITLKKLNAFKRDFTYKSKRKDDMVTFMDMYLYNIAGKQGKIRGGIEDLADQLQLVDDFGPMDINRYLNDDTVQIMDHIEQMKQDYINGNLTSINKTVSQNYSKSYKDAVIIKRNAKMAIRIDSLSHIRNSFFAVGAAHLPGDSGLISRLQNKGFTVEPVFSDKFIAPEEYKYNGNEAPWVKVESENEICTVEMPGKPSSMTVKNDMEMKMYVDLSALTYYGLGVSIITPEEAASDSLFLKIIDNYKHSGLEIIDKKNIDYNGMKGIEMSALQGGVNFVRYRILVQDNKLMLILFGGPKKELLTSADAIKFFNSLVFNSTSLAVYKPWEEFIDEKNAFKMKFPTKPKFANEPIEGSTITADKYMAADITDGSYYILMITDVEQGFYIESDSTYFEDYKKSMVESTGRDLVESNVTTFKGMPALHLIASQKEDGLDLQLQVYLIRRGNRTYTALALTPKERANFPQVTNFFRSFEPLEFKKTVWKRQSLPDTSLSTLTPIKFEQAIIDSTSYLYNTSVVKYFACDKFSATNYTIQVDKISPYYWADNDSVYFRQKVDSYVGLKDSLISYSYKNGNKQRVDALIKLDGIPIYKRVCFILNGEKEYTTYSYLNEELLDNNNSKMFFDSITFLKKTPATIFQSKTSLLLQALKSADSTTFADASDQLDNVSFTKEDLPKLYDALLCKYKDDTDSYRIINDLIAAKINILHDSSTISFVEKNYTPKNDSINRLPMLLLTLLAENKTERSYALLKNLLINHPPVEGSEYDFIRAINDSIILTKSFFPGLTKLYGDSIVGGGIIKIANSLLDSNHITIENVLQNEAGVTSIALQQLKELKANSDSYQYYNSDVLKMLAKFNTKESNTMLLKFCSLPVSWIKANAIPLALKNNLLVTLDDIKKLAADKEWRPSFYTALKEIKKTSFFPKEFYTQQKFAESYVYNQAINDDEVDLEKMDMVSIKTAKVKGENKRFVLYKLKFDYNDAAYHLGICGPFDMNISNAEIKDDDISITIFYEEGFSQKNIEANFKTYLESFNQP